MSSINPERDISSMIPGTEAALEHMIDAFRRISPSWVWVIVMFLIVI